MADLSIEQLAQRLAGLEARLTLPHDAGEDLDYSDEALATVAARLYSGRRRRARYFAAVLLSDPAWDMLLDLFVAHVRGRQVGTISLCLAASVPATTALRWIGILEKEGLVARHLSEGDRRTKPIALTQLGYRQMRQYLIEGIAARDMPANEAWTAGHSRSE